MPNYDYRCPACFRSWEESRKIEDRHTAHCECGELAQLQIGKIQRPILFHEGWYEHGWNKPKYFTDKKQLIDACKEHDLTSPYVM